MRSAAHSLKICCYLCHHFLAKMCLAWITK